MATNKVNFGNYEKLFQHFRFGDNHLLREAILANILRINISNYNNSSKDLINEIVELIEDADEYSWIYNRQYKSKESITYWYYCSQQNTLLKKPRKNADPLK